MKLHVLLCSFLAFTTTLYAQQWVEIPDPNLRAALQDPIHLEPETDLSPFFNGDSLDVSASEVLGIESIYLYDDNISDISGIEFFTNLINLMVTQNNLQFINALPPALESLLINNNQLTQIPSLPTTLQEFSCSNNNLSSLPDLPEDLQFFSCSHNPLTALPSLPPSLKRLNCWETNLMSLPPLPIGLETLNCWSSPIQSLPALPESLTKLECDNCSLDSLPDLPSSLEYLYCAWNSIEVLPELPFGLENLSCHFNDLVEIPSLPNGLATFKCQNNELQCLPVLPQTLNILIYEGGGNDIQCLPNNPPNLNPTFSDPPAPVCNSANPNGCDWLTLVTGKVYHDQNDNCTQDFGEINLSNRIVSSSSGIYSISDSAGIYELYLDSGAHIISQAPHNSMWGFDCPSIPYTIVLDTLTDTITNIDFPNQSIEDCANLTISLSSSNQRPCFNNNSYHLTYCNHGTETAYDAYIDLELAEEITPLSSSTPWIDLGNNVIRFDLGDVAIDECGSISLANSIDCNAEQGFAICVRAEIFPTSTCFVGQPGWDNASIEVTANCTGSDNEFTISNTGTGNMSAPSLYRIFEGGSLFQGDTPYQLNAGESLTINVPADGQMYRLSADQSVGHPGSSTPQAWVEGCGMPSYQLGEILSFSQDDQDDHIDIECTELSEAYDPNDKTVVPAGYGAEHNIQMTDTLLEYRIRFQNTGSDTAFNVVVLDILDLDVLDITTFESGTSSHDYWVDITGSGTVSWHFDNIFLPDSNVNETASNGYVSFKIKRFSDLPLGTVINNSASIYFDFNAPILTNTSFVTLSEPPVMVSAENAAMADINIQPNPARDFTTIDFGQTINGQLNVIDAVGRTVLSQRVSSSKINLHVQHLEPGAYLIKVLGESAEFAKRFVKID